MRISDWSSDVCSSDLCGRAITVRRGDTERRLLSEAEVDIVMSGVSKPDDIILNDVEFWAIIENLMSTEPGYPALSTASMFRVRDAFFNSPNAPRSEEHTSELQSLMRISSAVFCLKKKKNK